MLVIRLSRTGRKKYSTYRVVAADSRRPANGKFVSILGHYNPHTKELVLKKEEIASYISNGAQPSNSIIRLLEKEKVKLPEWAAYHPRKKPSKAKVEKTEAAPTVTAAQPAAETAEAAPAETAETATGPIEAVKQAEKAAANVPNEEVTETAASDQKQADQAAKVEEVAAEAAVEAARQEPEQGKNDTNK